MYNGGTYNQFLYNGNPSTTTVANPTVKIGATIRTNSGAKFFVAAISNLLPKGKASNSKARAIIK